MVGRRGRCRIGRCRINPNSSWGGGCGLLGLLGGSGCLAAGLLLRGGALGRLGRLVGRQRCLALAILPLKGRRRTPQGGKLGSQLATVLLFPGHLAVQCVPG